MHCIIASFTAIAVRRQSDLVTARCCIAGLLPYGCGPQPPPPSPSPPPPPPPPPVVCSGSVYAFDDALGTDIIGYTSLPSNYGGGALTWINWNVINGTLWGLVRLCRFLSNQ
jgi:hypothetical protein